MTCNICGANEATIHLTEIVDNQIVEIHLCEPCAQEKGTDFKTHFNFGDLLAGLADFGKTSKAGVRQEIVKCSECGMSYDDFSKSGRLGCSSCYRSFSKILSPLIQRVQRSAHHLGKRPSKVPKSTRSTQDLRLLQERLRRCVQREAFEEAAQIRDAIKKLEEKGTRKRKDNKEKES